MGNLAQRMLRAARFDASLYEEVEADTSSMTQAVLVVILASLAGGIGATPEWGAGGLVGGAIGSLIGWYVWALLTYYIGTKWLPEPTTEADVGQMLRTLGFASAPGILRIAGVIPGVGLVALIVAPLWMLGTMVVAVRQALDYTSTGRAIVVCVIGFVVQVVVIIAVFAAAGALLGGGSGLPEA
jgi:Yip1 domain